MPLLTRLFTPENFATAAIFSSLLQLTGAFCNWRFDWLVPNSGSNSDAIARIICGMSVLILTVGTLIATGPFIYSISNHWKEIEHLDFLLKLLPIALIGLGTHTLLQSWFIRESNLQPVSKAKVLQSIGYIFAALLLYLLGARNTALVFAATVSAWCGAGMLIRKSNITKDDFTSLTIRSIVNRFARDFKLATVSTTVSLLTSMGWAFPIFAFSLIFSTKDTGIFALVIKLSTNPISVITNAIIQSFWSRASELARESEFSQLRKTYFTMTAILFSGSVLIAIGYAGISYFLPQILGDGWEGSGSVLRSLIPWIIGLITFTPSNHLVVMNRQSLQLVTDILRLALMALALVYAAWSKSTFPEAVFLLSCGSFLGHFLLFGAHLVCYQTLLKSHST
jgi:O-antigen/teichoic acid export membrane protein